MAKAVPTVVVKNKQGHLMRINVVDFDGKIHKPAGEAAAKSEKKSGAAEQIDAARSFKALEAIADEHGLKFDEALKPLTASKAHLLDQL
jgi:uncharacterized protein YidB (DUF937 family)